METVVIPSCRSTVRWTTSSGTCGHPRRTSSPRQRRRSAGEGTPQLSFHGGKCFSAAGLLHADVGGKHGGLGYVRAGRLVGCRSAESSTQWSSPSLSPRQRRRSAGPGTRIGAEGQDYSGGELE